jgi:arsenate reductase
MSGKKRVLILCTGNSCRSQMAEGWINHEFGETWEARSAGTRPAHAVHPLAVRSMAEVGVDISGGRPQSVDVYLSDSWDLVITVCDSARENCPLFPRPVETLHISFQDPAAAEGSEDHVINVFRTVRDAIRDRLLSELRARSV